MESKQKFKLFYDDNRLVKELENTKPADGYILIELFLYKEGGVLLSEMNDALGDKTGGTIHVFPFGKVLVDAGKYKAGDIVKISNEVAKPPENNPEYDSIKHHNLAYPNDARQLPSRYLGEFNIVAFLNMYSYDHRPFNKKSTPNYVVNIQLHQVECKMDVALLLK